MMNIDCLCSTCQVCQMIKKECVSKKYGLLQTKIAEYDIVFMVFVDLVVSFTIRTRAKTHSMLALTMIDPVTGCFEIVEATNKSVTSIQNLFHNTWLARYLQPQFIVSQWLKKRVQTGVQTHV
jgi:hypothetical protein